MKRVTTLLLLTGCFGTAHRDGVVPDDGPAPVTCGELVCDDIPSAVCEQATLTTFEAVCSDDSCQYPSTATECGPAGCCGDHCCSVPVSNPELGDLIETGLVLGPPNGMFNTDTQCTATSTLGACEVVTRTDLGLGEICVCRMDDLTIGSLRVTGSRGLALLAYRTVLVQTLLDVSADLDASGPGAAYEYATSAPGSNGAAGGSYATVGGASGNGPASVVPVYGNSELIPLLGGTRGQRSDREGGGAGGALQISAGIRITVNGIIDAGGGGGLGGAPVFSSSGGSGGGSGGAVLLEAPAITVMGAVVANGGGGGGGGNEDTSGGNGGGGNALATSGAGGFGNHDSGCALNGGVSGGDGGIGSRGDQPGLRGQGSDTNNGCLDPQFVGAGGGGGGAGRIRINSTSGCQCNGSFSPSPSVGTLVLQ